MKKSLILILYIACTYGIKAEEKGLKLGPLFTDHMILQQQQALPIWGTAAPKAKVMVSFGRVRAKAVADREGRWKAMLPAQKATFEGKALTIKAGKEQITLNDVVVGEIWVAAGQSNMEYTMRLYKTFQKPYKGEDLAALELQKPDNPKIRVFLCPRNGNNAKWNVANGESLAMMSAPGYYCVKNLQDSLQVPVGVITTAIGGTSIESWRKNGEWYQKMIAPYVPFAVRGFLWYQGENNCAERTRNYASLFKAMTTEWRREWGVADAHFLTVMLAPHVYSDRQHKDGTVDALELPRFRMQQMACLDSVSNTEMIFNPDLVDDLSDIHPSYKWEVGRCLAVLALNKVYGHTSLEWSGPRADNLSLVNSEKGEMLRVHFNHVGKGLHKQPNKYRSGYIIRWFEVAGGDGVWRAANATVEDAENVIVWSQSVNHPVSVRYLWHETATSADLRNSFGLCAFPFIMSLAESQ